MQKELMSFLENKLNQLANYGFKMIDEKPINYGIQIKLEKKNQNIPVNIYFSKKKGISVVIGGSPKDFLRPDLERIFDKSPKEYILEHEWNSWIGSDESGKGDFFGPLIVAGFYAERKIIPYLQQIGVQDSKKMSDKDIEQTGKRLYAAYFDQIKVITMLPEKYNQRYAEMKTKRKNLNDLLAWMHSRIIVDLHDKYHPNGVLIDKFTYDGRMRASLKAMQEINFMAKTKAESDPFVAAASIIARFHLNRWFTRVSGELDFKLPKGSGSLVYKAAQELVHKIGKEKLNSYAKLHFKNYERIK